MSFHTSFVVTVKGIILIPLVHEEPFWQTFFKIAEVKLSGDTLK